MLKHLLLFIDCYEDIYKWSLEHVGEFWEAVWKFCSVKASKSYDKVQCAVFYFFAISIYKNWCFILWFYK